MLCQQNTRRVPILQSCAGRVELHVQHRAWDCATPGPLSPTTARCHPTTPCPEDPAVTPRRLPVNSCAVRRAMAARQDLLTAPNRDWRIPGSLLRSRGGGKFLLVGLLLESASTGLGEGSNPSDLHPSYSSGHTGLILTRGRGWLSCCGVNPEDGNIPLPPWLLWLAGHWHGHTVGQSRVASARSPWSWCPARGPATATGCESPGLADSPINIYIHSRSRARAAAKIQMENIPSSG